MRSGHWIPDSVIGARVVFAFVAIGLLSMPAPYPAWGLGLTVLGIAMDGLDGLLARRLGVADDIGSVLDIAADRVVEHVYWIFFAVAGPVPLWVPLVVVTRSFVVDSIRGLAHARGRTAFGERTMMKGPLSRFLVGSRFMRTTYAVSKVGAFVLLGAILAAAGGAPTFAGHGLLAGAASITVWLAVGLNLLRGLPVVWAGRSLLADRGAVG